MSTTKPSRDPSYRHHKPSGLAFVELNGHRVYLGAHGSARSREKYHRVLREWHAAGRQAPVHPEEITIVEVGARFWNHAEQYYRRPDGTQTSEVDNYRQALRPLKALYGTTPAKDFGPLALQAVRDEMIRLGWCRTNINKQVGRLKQVFKWAAAQEIIPAAVYHALQAVTGLKRGRSQAVEALPIRPVPQPYVDAIRPHVSGPVWAIIELQLLTAARAGELVALRAVDLDCSGSIWTAAPEAHKTAHHGVCRVIYFGPRAQEVLRPFMVGRAVDAYIFSPTEAEASRRTKAGKQRKTPMNCGNVPGSNIQQHPKRKPGDHYDVSSYRRAIVRACKAAGVPQWHPHQLRHNAATFLRKEFGIETTRVILGHRSAAITSVYAELDQTKAVQAIRQVG